MLGQATLLHLMPFGWVRVWRRTTLDDFKAFWIAFSLYFMTKYLQKFRHNRKTLFTKAQNNLRIHYFRSQSSQELPKSFVWFLSETIPDSLLIFSIALQNFILECKTIPCDLIVLSCHKAKGLNTVYWNVIFTRTPEVLIIAVRCFSLSNTDTSAS